MDDKTRKYLIKYMKKTGRTKTLEVLKRTSPQKQKDERKAPLKLSFQIIKAPERKEIVEVKKPKQEKMKNSKDGIGLDDFEKKKKAKIPDNFKQIVSKFGLPEEHIDFFYEYRDKFVWEIKEKKKVYCTAQGCNFLAPSFPNSLVEHMAECHNYGEYPCSRVAISDRQNRHFRIGRNSVGRAVNFCRQNRQKSARSGNRRNFFVGSAVGRQNRNFLPKLPPCRAVRMTVNLSLTLKSACENMKLNFTELEDEED
ncbi:unnamed protein product [Oikopleura dioica]|uniref:Uncharacterized protein n=1 Tax=Oikopleura dioica TaxID=34765 RepID=E4YVM5_OIKDI|nr:unnamed protein product [Oikopleura dioica]